MHEITVSSSDLAALAEALNGGTAPAESVLRPLLAALDSETAPEPEPPESLRQTFDKAFAAEEPQAGHIDVRFKIGR
ncbi:hypothetical protein [Actinoplanes sp. GCM10030250]|uniref:hypothetical protein n=1 Tax=Actinoplanes sp. GCM10030250 TaxID=3273376 RepID=UPI0036156CDE